MWGIKIRPGAGADRRRPGRAWPASRRRHAAGVEDDDIVGDVEHQLRVLLDQHDRQSAFLELADGGHHLGDDLRGETLGRLVHQQHARVAHQRAADRQHLLLAAGQVGGDLTVPFAQPRKHGEHRFHRPRRMLAVARRACARRRSRFSRTVRLLKMRRPCGTSATPCAAIISGDKPGHRARRTRATSPRRGGNRPMVTFMQVDLPAPLRPSRPSMRASPSSNDTPCKHVAVAVDRRRCRAG